MTGDDTKTRLHTANDACFLLQQVLLKFSLVHEKRPAKVAEASPIVMNSMATALKCMRTNAMTPGQVTTFELAISKLERMVEP